MQLSLQSREIVSRLSNISNNTYYARIGSVPQATVYIQDEIILDFPNAHIEVMEGENLTLTVRASTASDANFTINVNISSAGNDVRCKLKRK